MNATNTKNTQAHLDADMLVVGAGFAGLYATYAARRLGYSTIGIETASDVGGTWYWNRYPGARCDVESIDYSYSFDADLQREWRWSERYATQPEILAYANHVADRFKLRQHFRFDERVEAAHFCDRSMTWKVTLAGGDQVRVRWIILAAGSLSTPVRPDIPGIDDFAGEVLYTAQWPSEPVSFAGKRVGVIGTGASGIQSIPIIAKSAQHLSVFQRSPNYSVPAFNKKLSDDEWQSALANYPERRRKAFASGGGSPHQIHPTPAFDLDAQTREALLNEGWTKGGVLFAKIFQNQTSDEKVNGLAQAFAEAKIREIVRDRATAQDLIPTDHPIGTKRICTDSGYFETYNRDNVDLVNLRRTPITKICATGVCTGDTTHELDMLVFATGFDAMTGTITRIDVRGPAGNSLADDWADGPITYLGMMVPGFPNLFNISGPGAPSVLANMVLAAEHQINWVTDLIGACERLGYTSVEARQDAASAWTNHVDQVAQNTLFTKVNSWYMGANIHGKKRTFMPYIGGFATYINECKRVRDAHYEGLVFGS